MRLRSPKFSSELRVCIDGTDASGQKRLFAERSSRVGMFVARTLLRLLPLFERDNSRIDTAEAMASVLFWPQSDVSYAPSTSRRSQ